MAAIRGKKVTKRIDKEVVVDYTFSNEDLSMVVEMEQSPCSELDMIEDRWEEFIDDDAKNLKKLQELKGDKIFEELKQMREELSKAYKLLEKRADQEWFGDGNIKKVDSKTEYFEDGTVKHYVDNELIYKDKWDKDRMKRYLLGERLTVLNSDNGNIGGGASWVGRIRNLISGDKKKAE